MNQSDIFINGYNDARDGFELEYFIKRGIVELKEISAYKAGWWSCKSGAENTEYDSVIPVGLRWK